MKKHLRSFHNVDVIFFATTLLAISAWAQQTPQEARPAPIPAQITSAKKIFIANAGVEGGYFPPDVIAGGPNRAYDQFYAAMKDWGRYDLASAPADADLVFEIRQINNAVGVFAPVFALRIIDPKTHITLWSLASYVQVATLTKTREKNYDTAMTTLVNELKIVATPTSSPAAKN